MKFNIIIFSLVGCFNYAVGSGSSSAVTNIEKTKTPLYHNLIKDLKKINSNTIDKVMENLIRASLSQKSAYSLSAKLQNALNEDFIINDTEWYDLISTSIDNDRHKAIVSKLLNDNCLGNITTCFIKAGLSKDSIDIILNEFHGKSENTNLNELLQRIEASNQITCYEED
ncbi:uncharacterized protein LOC126900899 isoform X3 [Daktulosphaira vitifoliae]|uniref:uncharacterized protein LOC126900899 isoform X3 n=1 Tax=Daktulosphaira vitifoliae TaxID=58002 RepID=UPI0021AAB593|nr:uncharacterized protein LOC126900899 isoform X3 [Daktulosphaira vitifoliae]